MKIFKKILKMIMILMLVVIVIFASTSYYRYSELKEAYPIEDIRETLKANIDDYIEFDEISKDLINATIAVEDRRFNDRYGFDYIAFARAMLTNLVHLSFVEGGSTIEQQFIKIYYFIYALDDNYTKDEIIEMYVNVINYGDGHIGIAEAARGYFNKEAKDLDLYEASLIAGIPNVPAYLQLSNNNPNTYHRQAMILEMMLEQGYILEEEYQAALAKQPILE